MIYTLTRCFENDIQTLGLMAERGLVWWFLEPPWLRNAPGISRVLPGVYRLAVLPAGDDNPLMRIRMVNEGVSYIDETHNGIPRFACDLHIGNYVKDTKGCPLTGGGVSQMRADGKLTGELMVTGSREAHKKLHKLISEDSMPQLRIREAF